MTTSQIYFNESLIKHGVIKDRELSVYCFKAKRIIGEKTFILRKIPLFHIVVTFTVLPKKKWQN